jgi:hypothetical protein
MRLSSEKVRDADIMIGAEPIKLKILVAAYRLLHGLWDDLGFATPWDDIATYAAITSMKSHVHSCQRLVLRLIATQRPSFLSEVHGQGQVLWKGLKLQPKWTTKDWLKLTY